MSEDGYAHRLAIAMRFAARMREGDAVFMGGAEAISALPYAISEKGAREFSGVNRLMLLQVMKDQGWADPRFFAKEQARQAGWSIDPDAKGISLQYLVASDADGSATEKPVVKRFWVFNASQIAGVPERKEEHERDVSARNLRRAVGKAGNGDSDFQSATRRWLCGLQGHAEPSQGSPVGMRDVELALASTIVEVATGVGLGVGLGPGAPALATAIEEAPMSFFEAARNAEALVALAMKELASVGIEQQVVDQVRSTEQESTMGQKGTASPRVEALFTERTAVLAVAYADKDRASALGAVYYAPQRLWFVPQGVDVQAFKEWLPTNHALGPTATRETLLASFRVAMEDLGLDTSAEVKDDGKWHHVPVTTKKSMKNQAGAYIVSLTGGRNGDPIGTIMNKHSGESFLWRYEGALLTPEQRTRMRSEVQAREAAALQAAAIAQEAAAKNAVEIWEAAGSAEANGYVIKKGIGAQGLRQVQGATLLNYPEFRSEGGATVIREKSNYLVVPMRDEHGELRALQAISDDGKVKAFMRGAQKKGTMCVLGADSFDVAASAPAVAYAEGVATGASFTLGSGMPVIVCFDAGNLESVYAATSPLLSTGTTPVLALDNDQFHVERALGFLAERLDVNPHSPGEAACKVSAGASALRTVGLGDLVADGAWHTVQKGTYAVSLVREEGREAVRSVVVEVVPKGERKIRATFSNRGVEAGRAAIEATATVDTAKVPGSVERPGPVIVLPVFESLDGRPTDWNDLHAMEGIVFVQAALKQDVRLKGLMGVETANVVGRQEMSVSIER